MSVILYKAWRNDAMSRVVQNSNFTSVWILKKLGICSDIVVIYYYVL